MSLPAPVWIMSFDIVPEILSLAEPEIIDLAIARLKFWIDDKLPSLAIKLIDNISPAFACEALPLNVLVMLLKLNQLGRLLPLAKIAW